MNRIITILGLSVFLQLPAYAQLERTIYQVFSVDSVQTVNLDFVGIYEVHFWAGSSILLEMNIQISHASTNILNHLIKEGRYDVIADSSALPDQLTLRTKDRERRKVHRPDGEITEIAKAKIFIPDTFIISDDKKRLSRKN